nr:hypothetical protein [Mesorhizobium sp.]
MRLTSDLVAQVMLNATDTEPGPMPAGRRPATEADLQGAVRNILASAPPRDQMWILRLWLVDLEPVLRPRGAADGNCTRLAPLFLPWLGPVVSRLREVARPDAGTRPRRPVNGIVFRLPADGIEENLLELARREIRLIPHSFPARWINVSTAEGSVRALTFAIDRIAPGYVGRLSPAEVADALAIAVGQFGYLSRPGLRGDVRSL